MADNDLSWNDVVDSPEDSMEMVESFDYVPAPRIIPGGTVLLSKSRTTKPKKAVTGKTFFEISFIGGLENPNTGALYSAGQYPEKARLFGFKREEKTDSGGKGFTTDIASYIKKCGLKPTDFSSVKAALEAADQMPVLVRADLEDDLYDAETKTYRKREKGEKALRTNDFKKEDGTFATIITKDGKTFKARNIFRDFIKIPTQPAAEQQT